MVTNAYITNTDKEGDGGKVGVEVDETEKEMEMEKEKEIIKYCFDCLRNKYDKSISLKEHSSKDESCCNGIFVTWKKDSILRGCIGTFETIPLYEGLKKFSLKSAFEDGRFSPIKENEIDSLQISINIILNKERVTDDDHKDWEIGLHGLELIYAGRYSSTFLPQVIKDEMWTKEETLKQLFIKAGLPSRTIPKDNFVLLKYRTKKIEG